MGPPPPHNRGNLQQPPPNFNQRPPLNRPDFYSVDTNNPSSQQHISRGSGRPSRFNGQQEDYEDDRPLTKPNFSLPNVATTTTPLYINQSSNPTFSHVRPQMAAGFSSQQPPPGTFQQNASVYNSSSSAQFGWPNPQSQQQQSVPNSHITQSLVSLASNDQQSTKVSGGPALQSFHGANHDVFRQQNPATLNPYYTSVPPVPQPANKIPNANGKFAN